MMKENKLIDWDDHIDKKYGSAGSPAREKYEQEFQAFLSHILVPIEKKQKK
ncbi:hypothetical protein [Dyadobacter bucti]|jgi:hypothetical protein|uniref:hypothetical protein n=1 Tax=Dyadobacter bucti TaxID=2572203 RepID=UPI00140E9197|nr:hypothetical protein [Dyadobacter bucti]